MDIQRTNLIGLSGYIGAGKTLFAKMICMAIFQQKASQMWTITEMLEHFETISGASGWEIKAFATPLKQTACIFLGCTMEQLEDAEFKKSKLGPEWDRLYYPIHLGGALYKGDPNKEHSIKSYIRKSMTVREFLQLTATNALRDQVHPNIHINAAFAKYKPSRYFMCDECGAEDILEIKKEDTCPRCGYESEENLTMVLDGDYSKWIFMDMRFPNEMEAIKSRGGICIRLNRGAPSSGHSSETSLDHIDNWDEVVNNVASLESLYNDAKMIVNKYKLS